MLRGDRHADQTATEAGHEVDCICADAIGCNHQVAFVLAVFFIDQDHHPSRRKLGHDVCDRTDAAQGC